MPVGFGRSRRRLRAKAGPNFRTQRRTFVGGLDPALSEELLNVTVVQGKAQIEPNGVPDDLGWELVASIGYGLPVRDLPRHLPGPPPS